MELDQVAVQRVLPAEVAPTAPRGEWQCCSCGGSYPVHEGWKVFYDTVPGVTVVAYVCPTCAEVARRDAGATDPDALSRTSPPQD